MTASKPEVTQLLHEYRADLMRRRYPDNDEGDRLVRERDSALRRIARAISDHEAARAADKARIAELEQYNRSLDEENARLNGEWSDSFDRVSMLEALLADCRESVVDCENYAQDEGSDRRVQYYREQLARIDAALAQQGKEGGA